MTSRWTGLLIASGVGASLLAARYAFGALPEQYEPEEPDSDEAAVPPPGPVIPETTQLTAHLKLSEFAQRAAYGLPRTPYPTAWVATRLKPLAAALERLRTELGNHAMRISSGYRSLAYNEALRAAGHSGVAKNSQHSLGRAADIVVTGVAPSVVHATALKLAQSGAIRIGGLGKYPTFTHIDVRPGTTLAQWQG